VTKIKNMSRGGYIVVGIVVALLLVPTAAYAATLYNGIVGSSGKKANVTAAGQLLTTEALPKTYQDYDGNGDNSAISGNPSFGCNPVGSAIPAGKAFVVQQVSFDIFEANAASLTSGVNVSNAGVELDADPPGFNCDSYQITSADPPDGDPGNVAIPLTPGYVVPSGYQIDMGTGGLDAYVEVTGYLVPSADAPATPQIVTNGTHRLRAARP
jgi:hypothetical protein